MTTNLNLSIAVRNIDLQKQFGASVRASRSRLHISQEELAERAGLHRTYVCDIERGARNVSLKSIEKIARALEISLADLFASAEAASAEQSKPLCSAVADILLVEDDPGDAESTLQTLRAANVTNRIHTVRDGAAALDFLFCTGEYSERPPACRPQMILLDLTLPKVNGVEVLTRIKTDARTRPIPVAVLAQSKVDPNIALSEQLGAEAHIVKPLDFLNFSEVASHLNLKWALLKNAPALQAGT
jgi:CheY-like chemotaxis protein/DNA-binding XRE family transcriptional regulator